MIMLVMHLVERAVLLSSLTVPAANLVLLCNLLSRWRHCLDLASQGVPVADKQFMHALRISCDGNLMSLMSSS